MFNFDLTPKKSWKKNRETVFTFELLGAELIAFWRDFFHRKFQKLKLPILKLFWYYGYLTVIWNLFFSYRSSLDVKLQRQFHQLVSLADERQVEDFLSRHLAQLEVNGFNGEGRTALQQSCLEGNLSMAKVLVKYGADSQQSTRDGFSTFHLAVFSGHSTLMTYILSLWQPIQPASICDIKSSVFPYKQIKKIIL